MYSDEQPLPRDVVKAIFGSRYATFTEATRVTKREGELLTGTDGARLLKRDGVYFAVTTDAWSSPLAWRALSEGELETLKERLGSKF